MKVKNITKILIIALISLLIISLATTVYGASTQKAIDEMIGMSENISDTSGGKLGGVLNSIIGLIQIVGTGIAAIMVTVLGIKYIMAAPSDKADVKKQIAPMVVGAIVLFGSVNLVNIITKLAMSTLQSAAK